MCGIAGLVARGDTVAVDEARLTDVREAMAHRGPDGAGTWLSANRRVGLAHRRLAIVDLDPRADQPFVSTAGDLAIVFNGEIYNYVELRSRLEDEGVAFRTTSDTEVLLELFRARGPAMLDELRGMYAFAIWRAEDDATFLARDPYGIKPLYLREEPGLVAFASEVRALLRLGVPPLDPAGVVGLLSWGTVPEPHTCYQSIRALPAGHSAMIREGRVAVTEHTSVARLMMSSGGDPHDVEETRAALRDSVRAHMVADVPVGAFLSAGIDSSSIVALMSEYGSSIETVTLGARPFMNTASDEVPLAEVTAAHYGTDHRTVWLDSAAFRGCVPNVLTAMDQPTIDGFNTWLVSRAARERGLKVAVSGLGGDELFGGYPSFQDVPRWVRWGERVFAPRLGKVVERLASRMMPWLPKPKAAGALRFASTHGGAYFLRRGVFLPEEARYLFDTDFVDAGLDALRPDALATRALDGGPEDSWARVALLEATLYMRNQLLRDCDWAGMWHGLEIRVPLVDAALLRRLAPAMRARALGKATLAKAPRRALPADVVARKKTGFSLPWADWLFAGPELDAWRCEPALRSAHWSRKLTYTLAARVGAPRRRSN